MRKFQLPILNTLLGRRERRGGPPSLVVVGLGNPGREYAETRHNIGFRCIDQLAREHSISLERRSRQALKGEGVIDGHCVALAKPRTYVNLSGQAVSYLLARYRVSPRELLIVYDEVSLPPGKLRLRPGGGAGGHNGIKSIIGALGTQDFPRLRIGVGKSADGTGLVRHVLGEMPHEEREAVDGAVGCAVALVSSLLTEGIDVAMNRFN